MMNIKAALFDLDGTLADSMWAWRNLMNEFVEKHNLNVPRYIYEKVSNMSLAQSSVYVSKELKLNIDADELYEEWMGMITEAYSQKIKLRSGAEQFLKKLKDKGVKIGLVTACSKALCEACLENNGVYELFDAITYVDEVGKGKSEPDIYLEGLRRLGFKAEEAVLFEDIIQGIRTAAGIGLKTVGVWDEESAGDEAEIKRLSEFYIHDYYEIMDKF